MAQKAIGILTSGGDCPGLNAAIRSVGKAARGAFDMQIIGFRDGFRGLVENRTVRLENSTLGVVGVGNIGSKVVRMAEGLGMKVMQNDPPLARATGESRFLPLDALMEANIVTLHVPLTHEGQDATYQFFDANRISKMKLGSILINTSRGPVVSGEALKAALESGRLAGAVLDVWENEPEIDVHLLEHVNLGTSHIAGYSLDGKANGTAMIYKAVCEFLQLEAT